MLLFDGHKQKNFNYRPCLVHPKNQKLFKISRHIESFGTCMKTLNIDEKKN